MMLMFKGINYDKIKSGRKLQYQTSQKSVNQHHNIDRSQRNTVKSRSSSHQKKQLINKQSLFLNKKSESGRKKAWTSANKCISDVGVRPASTRRVKFDQDIRSQVNKQRIQRNKVQIELDLQQVEKIRETLVNQITENKIKIGPRLQKEQITRDIVINQISSPEKSNKLFEQSPSNQIQFNQYQAIANEIHLKQLQSKVIHPAMLKRQQVFLNKLQQSESGVILSPSVHKNVSSSIKNSQTRQMILQSHANMIKDPLNISQQSHSILEMNSVQQEALNLSVQKDIENKLVGSKQTATQIKKNGFDQNQPQTKKQQYLQSKIMIATHAKPNVIENYKQKSILDTKLNITSNIIEYRVPILEKQNQIIEQQQEKHRLNEEIGYLRKAVRQLRLQKIKQIASSNSSVQKDIHIQNNSTRKRTNSNTKRYQAIPQVVDLQKFNQSNQLIYFGRIRKNRLISGKRAQITLQRSLERQNINNNPTKINYVSMNSKDQNSGRRMPNFALDEPVYKEYNTMTLQKIAQENIEESIKFHRPLSNSIQFEVGFNQIKSNTITGRGQLCSRLLDKFDSNDRKFRNFIKRNTPRNKSNRKEDTEQISTEKFKNSQEYQRGSEYPSNINNTQLKKYESNSLTKKDNNEINMSPNITKQIKQGERLKLAKLPRNFTIKTIPNLPQNPQNTTSTDDLMDLILKLLPLTKIVYSQQDLQKCILKKYKNCLMFQLPTNSLFRIIWHFNSEKLYMGEWSSIDNQKSGFGIQFIKNKYYYQGQFYANKRNGKGIIVYDNKSIYEGEWLNGGREGFGKYYDAVQKSYYEGQWISDKMEGKGHFEFQNNIYEGNFIANLKNGYGVQLFLNGDKYIGYYSNDKFNGEGKYIWYNYSFYFGHFYEGYRQGYGKWQSSLQDYQLYIGQFNKDKKQGEGKYIWPNRCIYEGSFFNDLKHGLGNMQYPDGRYIQGIWTQGIITQVLSKVTEANKQQPLQQPKHRTLHEKTIIRIIDTEE